MITDKINNSEFYIKHFPSLSEAFGFISSNEGKFREGKHIINDDMYAVVEKSFPKPREEQKLEVHKKYVDLQYIIEGSDIIGWKSLSECADIFKKYEDSKDIAFFNEAPDFNIVLTAGSFALFFPDDAHSPLSGSESVLKCIIKIKTELFF
ncbi:MAG: YhcH/YjgK/YiaL family protein [Endomicrobia bacterium]|nr:YhcH/YjgK/YiaL family protein [Endomicrobiia bacterium]